MKKTMRIVAIALVAALLIACDGFVTITLYVQDLIELRDQKQQVLYTTVKIESSAIDDEEKMEFIKQTLNGVTNVQKSGGDFSTSYTFEVSVPILGPNAPESLVKENDLLWVKIQTGEKGTQVSYKYNDLVIDKISAWTSEKYFSTINKNDFKVSVNIENDSQGDFTFSAWSVYVNSEPFPFEYTGKIARREKLTLSISDIFCESINKEEGYSYFLEF